MELMNIRTAFSFAKTLYGVDMKESDFEEIALNAWELIGTKHTELRQFIGNSNNGLLELPCDCVDIETVSLPIIDSKPTDIFDGSNVATELYSELKPRINDPRYNDEKLLKYKRSGNRLQFDKDYNNILVVYHGVLMDDTDLPLINDKEMRAIAAYTAYASTYKEGLMKKDSNIISMANVIKAEWLQYCNAARVSSHINQNEMDAILDAKYSWDRKHYGISYKAIK